VQSSWSSLSPFVFEKLPLSLSDKVDRRSEEPLDLRWPRTYFSFASTRSLDSFNTTSTVKNGHNDGWIGFIFVIFLQG